MTQRFGFFSVQERSEWAGLAAVVVAVGHEKEPLALVRSADLGSGETTPLRIEPSSGQVSDDASKSLLAETRDVLENDGVSPGFVDDSEDVIPEPPFVSDSELSPGLAEGLAGETSNDDTNAATPRAAVKRGEVRPYRRRIQPPFVHARSQDFDGEGFPFNVADDASSWERQVESSVESPDAGTEGENSEGTTSHTLRPPGR